MQQVGERRAVALELRPTNPQLSRVRVDLAMAGAEIDLTGIRTIALALDDAGQAIYTVVAGLDSTRRRAESSARETLFQSTNVPR